MLATNFTSGSGSGSIDLSAFLTDSSTHGGGGMVCLLFLNYSRLSCTINYYISISTGGPGELACRGDGFGGSSCPCANSGIDLRGCANSLHPEGAGLHAIGDAAADSVVFIADRMLPGVLAVLMQGDAQLASGLVFGDGVRCTGGTLKRLYSRSTSVTGSVVVPWGSDPSVKSQSSALGDPIPSGATRFYALMYRDPSASFCPPPGGSTFNVSNGYNILWP